MSSNTLMIKLPNTLSFRLTLWYASTFLMCLLFAFTALYFSLHSILTSRMDDDLMEDIAEFQELFSEEGLEEVLAELEREINSSDESEVFFRLYDEKGQIIFRSDFSEWEGLEASSTFAPPSDLTSTHSVLQTLSLPGQDYPARMISGLIGPNTIIQIGETLGKKEEIMELLFMVFAVMFFLGIPLASGVGWAIARKAVTGIEEVSRAAQAIEGGNLDRRVSVKGQGDEIQTLANTFNAMATRVKSLIHEMREMTDNIAHDLRSPLARIRAMSEVALSESEHNRHDQKAANDTLKECDRLINLINTTLDMAEVDAGVTNGEQEPINLSRLISDLCELFEPVAENKHITLDVSIAPQCHILGHKHNLQRMVANLLDNAMKYTPRGGKVCVELTQSSEQYRLTVSDTGIGIPQADQTRVFDRFFRCDHSRSQEGCGLGLSFARSVARAHGGDITVRSEVSQGSTFTGVLPVTLNTS